MTKKANKRPKMVGWYDPGQLLRTSYEVFISTIFGRHADRRLLEALSLGAGDESYQDYSDNPAEELWIDYIADVGDGFNSTYTMAYYMTQPTLDLKLKDERGQPIPGSIEHTRRGYILIFGGDEVYPVATAEEYANRLINPYNTAFPPTDATAPDAFAIPGNHDWYDSLVSFTELFCRHQRFCGWQTRQNRSYFALQLTHGWWLFGTDMQLGASLDDPQMDYFRRVVDTKMKAEDRIILCNAEPHWIKAHIYPQDPDSSDQKMEYFEEEILQGRVTVHLAGDLHHYRRHMQVESGVQKITAGGGGAFLYPTHGPDVSVIGKKEKFHLQKNFPEIKESRRLCWYNLLFLFRNPRFGVLTGLLYLLTARAFMSDVSRFGLSEFGSALHTVFLDLLTKPFALFWVAVTLLGFLLFTDTHSRLYRLIVSPIHGLVHLFATFFIGWGASRLVSRGQGLDFSSIRQLLLTGLLIFIGGWIVGSVIMGIYLLVSLNVFGRHSNEAFSALACPDWKNFLRLKIDTEGDLTIFPVGVRHVARKWKGRADGAQGLALEPDDPKVAPELIEAPVKVTKHRIERVERMTATPERLSRTRAV